ncbi:hypothetical protein [Aquimarina agarilytica]|uniref:hypothetical protein n=1 Tax=Aquimarina agarilytica TaxID=1087449 RepID=UPI0002884BE8|nr:hypothetical protein [Aquimarina agarilytica]
MIKTNKIKSILLFIVLIYSAVFYGQGYNESGQSPLESAEQYAKENGIPFSINNGPIIYPNALFTGDISNVSIGANGEYGVGYYEKGTGHKTCFLCYTDANQRIGAHKGEVTGKPRFSVLHIRLPKYKFIPYANQSAIDNAFRDKERFQAANGITNQFNLEIDRLSSISNNLFERERGAEYFSDALSNGCPKCIKKTRIPVLDDKGKEAFTVSLKFKETLTDNESHSNWIKAGVSDTSVEIIDIGKKLAKKAPTPPKTHSLGRARKPIENINRNKVIADLEKAIKNEELKLNQDLVAEAKKKLDDLITNPPSLIASKEVHREYLKKSAIALSQFNTSVSKHQKIVSAIEVASTNAGLTPPEYSVMSNENNKILKNGKNVDYNWNNLSAAKEAEVTKSATFLEIFKEVKITLSQYFPKNQNEWNAIASIMAPLLVEVGLSAIPGSEIIDIVRGINEEDYVAIGLGVAGLTATIFGGKIIKVLGVFARQLAKTFKIVRVIGKHLKTTQALLDKGFKIATETVGALSSKVVILKKRANGTFTKLISGDHNVKTFFHRITSNGDNATQKIITNLADKVNDAQKTILSRFKDNIASASNARKGNYGEMATDLDLSEKGFIPLHRRISNIDEPGHQGIDAVFERNGKYFIVESKFSKTTIPSLNSANRKTGLPKQMSDDWISQRDYERLRDVTPSLADDIIDNGYTRVIATHGPNGKTIYNEISSTGKIVDRWYP